MSFVGVLRKTQGPVCVWRKMNGEETTARTGAAWWVSVNYQMGKQALFLLSDLI